MTNPPPELFPSERPVPSSFARAKSYRLRRTFTILIAVGLIGGGIYEIYLWKRTPIAIPTIHAETSLKQKPEQPGGIDIPNQDVTAYQQIDGNESKPSAVNEHLLPPPETPQPSAAPVKESAIAPTPPGTSSIENLIASAPKPIETTVTPPQPAAVVANTAPSAPTPVETLAPAPVAQASVVLPVEQAPTAVAQKTDDAAASEKPASAPVEAKNDTSAPTKSVAGKGGFRAQLASYPDEELAKNEMDRMQVKYEPQLNGAKLHLVKADLGTRGIYYRVQTGTMNNNDANGVCTALKNLKAGCIVVKP